MTVEELLQKVIIRDISLAQGLMLSKVMFKDSMAEESYRWVCNELEHYDDPKQLPEYRILDCTLKVQVSGPFFEPRIEELDTSVFNRHLKKTDLPYASPNKMLVRQSIESIEDSIDKASDTVQMVLPVELTNMMLQYYSYPSGYRIEKMFQEARVELIKNIISCVRNRFISIIEKEILPAYQNNVSTNNVSDKKKVFISYGWDDENHCEWVKSLAERLNKYFEVSIDVKIPFGADINTFMEQKIKNSDRVLIILTPKYKEKADLRQNGVGYESILVSSELYNNQGTTKFIPIIRKGTIKDSYPLYLGNRKGLDMTDDNQFEDNMSVLIEDIKNN